MKVTRQNRYGLLVAVVLVLLSLAFSPLFFEPGLNRAEPMGAYLNGAFPEAVPIGFSQEDVGYGIVNAFPNLTFVDPVDMLEIPGRDEFLVLGLQGQLWKFSKDAGTSSKRMLLDISDNVVNYADGGMLGMVLHPEYGQNGSPNSEYIYMFYRYTPVQGTDRTTSAVNGYMRLSRFELPVGANAINPSSEQVLINVFDRHDWHNGGDMFFGPNDGFLYLVVGDEGAANDSYNVTQQIDKWLFGGVLRIDVDKRGGAISHPIRKQPLNAGTPPAGWPDSFTQDYFIPNDNPWQDTRGGILEEFYAIGTRSPHRMTLDAETGDIWIGDIGQGAKEEVSVVRKGDNLQWPYREGDQNGPAAKPDPLIGNDRPPIHAYGRTTGRSVIGGLVYRGNRYPELQGKYIFGDHETQDIWTLTKTGENSGNVHYLLNVPVEGVGSKDGISSFFVDSDGFLYVLDLYGTAQDGGVIHKLVRNGSSQEPPNRLSELNVFSDLEALTPIPGIVPYDVNVPLWSDGATKRRWIALPNDGTHNSPSEQIGFDREDNWSFPPGTVAIKHFDLPLDANDVSKSVKLETRFLIFTENGEAYGVTYKWNEQQTDAFLVGIDEAPSETYQVKREDGSTVDQTWNFPSRSQCIQCHNSNAGYALGLKTRQLNKNFNYPSTGIVSNQLETWNHLNMFGQAIDGYTKLPASAGLNTTDTSDEMKVRSYLDANCAFCHRPNGVEGAFDGRAGTALYDQALINADVVSRASVPGHQIVRPQDALSSALYVRDASSGSDKMPPIGRNLTDETYLETLIGWIDGLDANGPESIEAGTYTLQARHSNKYLAVRNASTASDAQAVQVSDNSGEATTWIIEGMGNKKYRITASHSGMALSARDLRAGQGAEIIQEPWSGEQQQLWYFEDTDNGYYRIINAYNSLEVDVFGGEVSENVHTILWKPHGGGNQQWKLVPAGPAEALGTIGEMGKARANHTWSTVNLRNSYENPVVITGGASFAGTNAATVRVRNRTANSFEVRIDEWECQDEWHLYEDIPYMVVEAGIHELPNGKILQAGNIEGVTQNWYTQSFDRSFEELPLVFGQCVTENEPEAVSVSFDERYVSQTQLRFRLKEQEQTGGSHAPETVSWLAVEPGSFAENGTMSDFEAGNTGRQVNHDWYTLNFGQTYDTSVVFIGGIGSEYGGDTKALRFRNLSNGSVQVFVEEETCRDTERQHTKEEVHYLCFNEPGDIQGKTIEQTSSGVALKSQITDRNFYFTDVASEKESHLVQIQWTVSADSDILSYEVERSVDGHHFALVSDQPASRADEQVRYHVDDPNPVAGRSEYRVVAVTVTDERLYSQSIPVSFDVKGNQVMVYPNPTVSSRPLTADIVRSDTSPETLQIRIYSADGREVLAREKLMDSAQSFEQFDLSELTSGVYILRVEGRGWAQSKRFIVE